MCSIDGYSKGFKFGKLYGKFLCQLDCDLFFSYCNDNYCVCFGPLTDTDVAAREQQTECCLAAFCWPVCYPCYMAGKINSNVWQQGKILGPKEQAIKDGIFWENFCLACLVAVPVDREQNPLLAAAQDAASAVFYYSMRKSVVAQAGEKAYEGFLLTCCYANCCGPCNLAQLEALQEKKCRNFDPNNCDDKVPMIPQRMERGELQAGGSKMTISSLRHHHQGQTERKKHYDRHVGKYIYGRTSKR